MVFLESPFCEGFVDFWSNRINNISLKYPIGTLFVIALPINYSDCSSSDVADYVRRRFKAQPALTPLGLHIGFKGSLFRPRAMVVVDEILDNISYIVLEKIKDAS